MLLAVRINPAEVKALSCPTVKAGPLPVPAGSHLTSCISLLAGVWGTLRSSISFPVAEAEAWTDWQGDQLRKRQKHTLEQAYQYASTRRPLPCGLCASNANAARALHALIS